MTWNVSTPGFNNAQPAAGTPATSTLPATSTSPSPMVSPANEPGILKRAINAGNSTVRYQLAGYMAGSPEHAFTSIKAMKNYLAWGEAKKLFPSALSSKASM